MTEKNDVRGRTIVVTGASSGFGRGAAVKLAEAGAIAHMEAEDAIRKAER